MICTSKKAQKYHKPNEVLLYNLPELNQHGVDEFNASAVYNTVTRKHPLEGCFESKVEDILTGLHEAKGEISVLSGRMDWTGNQQLIVSECLDRVIRLIQKYS